MSINLSELTGDGNALDIGNGQSLRLRIESDDISPFEETDTYGRIAGLQFDRFYRHGERPRPDGFNGNAEKLYVPNNGGTYWWQPPADGPKRGTDEFKGLRKRVLELLEYGYCAYVLELLEGENAYHEPIVRKFANLGEIEPFPTVEYRAEIVRNLWTEIQAQS